MPQPNLLQPFRCAALVVASALMLTAPLASAAVSAAATSFCDPTGGWTLDWEDNFDGDSLDLSSWTPLTSDAGGNIGSCRDAWCTPSAVAVAGGTLVLTTDHAPPGGLYGRNFTSGAVNSQGKRSWAPSPWCARRSRSSRSSRSSARSARRRPR